MVLFPGAQRELSPTTPRSGGRLCTTLTHTSCAVLFRYLLETCRERITHVESGSGLLVSSRYWIPSQVGRNTLFSFTVITVGSFAIVVRSPGSARKRASGCRFWLCYNQVVLRGALTKILVHTSFFLFVPVSAPKSRPLPHPPNMLAVASVVTDILKAAPTVVQ